MELKGNESVWLTYWKRCRSVFGVCFLGALIALFLILYKFISMIYISGDRRP